MRRHRTPGTAPLTDRQRFALHWLSERADTAPPPDRAEWRVPRRTAAAWALGDAMLHAGLAERPRRGGSNGLASGAANTLSSLARRGLTASDGGGAWLSAQWWLTPAGAAALNGLEANL